MLRVLDFDPVPEPSAAAVGALAMLGDHALQPHQAGMAEQVRAVSCQMFIEPDGSPLGLANQSGEPPLALDPWQVGGVSV